MKKCEDENVILRHRRRLARHDAGIEELPRHDGLDAGSTDCEFHLVGQNRIEFAMERNLRTPTDGSTRWPQELDGCHALDGFSARHSPYKILRDAMPALDDQSEPAPSELDDSVVDSGRGMSRTVPAT